MPYLEYPEYLPSQLVQSRTGQELCYQVPKSQSTQVGAAPGKRGDDAAPLSLHLSSSQRSSSRLLCSPAQEEHARVEMRNSAGWASTKREIYEPLGNPEDSS